MYIKIVVNALVAIGIALFLFLVFPKLLGFFLPFVIGWIVALIANPLVKFLEKKVKILRKHSSAIIIVMVIAAIVGVIYLLIAMLIRESKQLAGDLPNILEQTGVQLTELSIKIRTLSSNMPEPIELFINNMLDNISKNLMEYDLEENPLTMSVISNMAQNIAQNIAEVFLTIIMTILSAYFFIAKRDEITTSVKNALPSSVVEG